MSSKRRVDRRRRRIEARRAQILEAAAAIFSEKGYERATTREIADAADVSEGTLYNYFGSKRDLLLGRIQEVTDETSEAIARVQADGIEAMVAEVLSSRFRLQQKHRLLLTLLHEARLDPDIHRYYAGQMQTRIVEEMVRRMQALLDAGVMRPVNPELAARTFFAVVLGFGIQFELGGDALLETTSPEELAAVVTDIFLNGLRAQADGGREGHDEAPH